jgi:SWI/SNF-related matrix-associated actin-dependent regulator of chromatin subfamily A-like protein 1
LYVILDEGQYISNPKAKRTRATRKLCKDAKHIAILTGTPVSNVPAEIWTMLNILDPQTWDSYFSFCMEYTNAEQGPWGWMFKGSKNLKRLHNLCRQSCMMRKKTSQVIKDLPPKIRSVVPMELSKVKEYKRAESDFIRWLAEQDLEKAARAARAERLVKFGYLLRLAARLKLPCFFKFLDDLLADMEGKLLIFAIHKTIIKKIRLYLKSKQITHRVIDGSKSPKQRQEAEETFQTGDCRVLVGQITACGMGLNLTAAHTAVFLEASVNPSKNKQAEGRLYARLNDLHSALIYYTPAENTIEERLLEILQEKESMADKVVDGGSGKLEGSVYDLLQEALLKKGKR